MFVGFAGDLVVGVWVGRDDNKSLGKISGGTVPAEIWRSFMSSALAIDHTRGPNLPTDSIDPSRRGSRNRITKARCRPNGAMLPSRFAISRNRSRILSRSLDESYLTKVHVRPADFNGS